MHDVAKSSRSKVGSKLPTPCGRWRRCGTQRLPVSGAPVQGRSASRMCLENPWCLRECLNGLNPHAPYQHVFLLEVLGPCTMNYQTAHWLYRFTGLLPISITYLEGTRLSIPWCQQIFPRYLKALQNTRRFDTMMDNLSQKSVGAGRTSELAFQHLHGGAVTRLHQGL